MFIVGEAIKRDEKTTQTDAIITWQSHYRSFLLFPIFLNIFQVAKKAHLIYSIAVKNRSAEIKIKRLMAAR